MFSAWPPRNSVKQPYTVQDVDNTTQVAVQENVSETERVNLNSDETEAADRATKNDNIKVDYTGAQVWQVATEKTGVRAILSRLRRRNRKLFFFFLINLKCSKKKLSEALNSEEISIP